MPGTIDQPVLETIKGLLQELNVKSAGAKTAEEEGAGSGSAAKDPGSKGGPSSSPTAKLDGNNHAAPAGFFAREHTEDVKKDVPNNVEEAKENKQDSSYDMPQIGMKASPTGEDPSTENDYRKGGKDDPGTSSPIDAEDLGEKYASMSFPELHKIACDLSNDVLARISEGETFGSTKTASANYAAPTAQNAAAAGAAASAALSPEQIQAVKFAAARDVIAAVIKEGYEDADLVGEYIYKSAQANAALAKSANDPMGGAMEGETGMDAGLPGVASGTAGDAAAMPPAMAGAAAGGEGGAGAPDDGMGGGEGGEGGVDEDAINEIANALIDSGIPPEKLMAAVQNAMAGNASAEPEAVIAGGEKAGSDKSLTKGDCAAINHFCKLANDHLESGRFKKVRPAPNSKRAHDRRDFMNTLGYVREVFKL